jgi:hypothetical protein
LSLPLAGMTIALVVPKTYDYSIAISRELENLGATVVRHEEWTEGVWLGISARAGLSSWLARIRQARYLENLGKLEVDCLLVIRGSTLPESFLLAFKLRFPNSKRIMYQWDSEQNNHYTHLIKHFDYCASFDLADCNRLDLNYLPLFFVRDLEQTPKRSARYDLCLIGAYTENRYRFYLKVKTLAEARGLTFKVFFFQPLASKLKDILVGRKLTTSSTRLDRSEVYRLMGESRCILDVHHSAQSGLTMRTIETLAMGKKLITTNAALKTEVFYNPESMKVVELDDPELDPDWLAVTETKTNIDHLRLDRWLIDLLGQDSWAASV